MTRRLLSLLALALLAGCETLFPTAPKPYAGYCPPGQHLERAPGASADSTFIPLQCVRDR